MRVGWNRGYEISFVHPRVSEQAHCSVATFVGERNGVRLCVDARNDGKERDRSEGAEGEHSFPGAGAG